MYAYGVCRGSSGLFEKVCSPGIEKFRASNDRVFVLERQKSMFAAYNRLLDSAAETDCEGMVLLHDDVEIRSDVAAVAQDVFRDNPDIALLGTVGGSDTISLAWWRELEYRRGRILDYKKLHDHGGELMRVDSADDVILCISRWTIDNFRFPTDLYVGFEGLGVIMSSYIRQKGKNVAVMDLGDIMHHNVNIGFNGLNWWRRNDLRWQRSFFTLAMPDLVRNIASDCLVPTVTAQVAVYSGLHRLFPRVSWLPVDARGESGDYAIDGLINRWYLKSQRLRDRRV